MQFSAGLPFSPDSQSPPVALAPMSGVTDIVMRRIARRLGASFVVSEMVASDVYVAGQDEARIRAEGAGLDCHIVQLAGRDPLWMGEAAKVAEASGAHVIDINMGCPAKRVTGGYAGSALMRDLDLASRLIESVCQAFSGPVSVKMRLGWDDNQLNAVDLARRAESLGVSWITVHGRTRCQFYKGKANWHAIGDVVRSVTIPVIANGDCSSIEDAHTLLSQSNAAGVMVGRAALGQPWLVGQIAKALSGDSDHTIGAACRQAVVDEHYDGLLSLMGAATGLRHARKHLAAYIDDAKAFGCDVADTDRLAILTSENHDFVAKALSRLYSQSEGRAAA